MVNPNNFRESVTGDGEDADHIETVQHNAVVQDPDNADETM